MSDSKGRLELAYYLNLTLSLGFTVSATIAIGGVGGYFVDKYLCGQVGLFFILGLVLGVVAAFYQAFCRIMSKEFPEDQPSSSTEDV